MKTKIKNILNLNMRQLSSQHLIIYMISQFTWYFAILVLGALAIQMTVFPVVDLPFAQAISSTFIIVIGMKINTEYSNTLFKDWLVGELFAKSLMFTIYVVLEYIIHTFWGI